VPTRRNICGRRRRTLDRRVDDTQMSNDGPAHATIRETELSNDAGFDAPPD
jgi:hypothetical protein